MIDDFNCHVILMNFEPITLVLYQAHIDTMEYEYRDDQVNPNYVYFTKIHLGPEAQGMVDPQTREFFPNSESKNYTIQQLHKWYPSAIYDEVNKLVTNSNEIPSDFDIKPAIDDVVQSALHEILTIPREDLTNVIIDTIPDIAKIAYEKCLESFTTDLNKTH